MKLLKNILLYLLIAFFSYTAINKLLNMTDFQIHIAKTSVFRGVWVDIVSWFAIAIEITSIILLVFKQKLGLIVSKYMMILFTFYILYLYATNKYEICGCGGILNGLDFNYHLIINIVIIVIILFLSRDKKR